MVMLEDPTSAFLRLTLVGVLGCWHQSPSCFIFLQTKIQTWLQTPPRSEPPSFHPGSVVQAVARKLGDWPAGEQTPHYRFCPAGPRPPRPF